MPALSLQHIFKETEFQVSSAPIDRDISTLNLLFYRSLNFIPYSDISACEAAQRGGGRGLKGLAAQAIKKTAYM